MSVEARIESLQRKHKNIHERIEALEAQSYSEQSVKSLKKQKLAIKDEIERLQHEQ